MPKIHGKRLEHELSSRAKRGILVFACSDYTGGAGKNQDPSLPSGRQVEVSEQKTGNLRSMRCPEAAFQLQVPQSHDAYPGDIMLL